MAAIKVKVLNRKGEVLHEFKDPLPGDMKVEEFNKEFAKNSDFIRKSQIKISNL